MNQDKITTYHLTDFSKMIIAGIALMAISALCSPKQMLPLCIGGIVTGLICFVFSMSISFLFIIIESSTFSGESGTFFAKVSKRFLGLLYEFLIETRVEKKKQAPEMAIGDRSMAEMPKDNYPW